jgi:hypothetical protein
MGVWNYYLVTDAKPLTLEDMVEALETISPDIFLDADLLVLREGPDNEESEELECAQIELVSGLSPEDRELFEAKIADKQDQARLKRILDQTHTLVVLQLLNTPFWWDNPPERTLGPLQDWLLDQYEGILMVDEGAFYDRQGLIL